MKEIKDQTDGKIYDRQAWFQIIPLDDMVTEKSDQRRYILSWKNL